MFTKRIEETCSTTKIDKKYYLSLTYHTLCAASFDLDSIQWDQSCFAFFQPLKSSVPTITRAVMFGAFKTIMDS